MQERRDPEHPLDWARRMLPDYFCDEPAAFHRELLGTLARGEPLVARVAPRGHAKSTCAALAYPLWCLCHQTRRNVVIITHESMLARQFVGDIRDELAHNERIRSAYPDVGPRPDQPASIWRNDRVTIGDMTVQAKSSGASLRGTRVGPQRPDLIICDDLEKDIHVRSALQRDALRHWLRRVAMPALAPDGQLVVVGSILHDESLLAVLAQPDRFPLWNYRKYRAIRTRHDEEGNPQRIALWPTRWSLERLDEERQRVGYTAFEQEYQGNPAASRMRVFERRWLRKSPLADVVVQRLKPLMAVDPATGVSGGDYFALWVGGLDTNAGVLYTYELQLARINIVEQVVRIQEAYRSYRPVQIGIETVAYQKALVDVLNHESRKQHLFMPVVSLQTHTNKAARIEGLAPLMQRGLLRFLCEPDDEVIHQFVRYPDARHDDAPDVCAMAFEVARSMQGSLEVVQPR